MKVLQATVKTVISRHSSKLSVFVVVTIWSFVSCHVFIIACVVWHSIAAALKLWNYI